MLQCCHAECVAGVLADAKASVRVLMMFHNVLTCCDILGAVAEAALATELIPTGGQAARAAALMGFDRESYNLAAIARPNCQQHAFGVVSLQNCI